MAGKQPVQEGQQQPSKLAAAGTDVGFSLIEVMVAGALSSMLMVGVTGGVIQTQRQLKQAKSVMGVQSHLTQVRSSLSDPSTCHQALASFALNQVTATPLSIASDTVALASLGQFEFFPGTTQSKWMPLLVVNRYTEETAFLTKSIALKRVPDSIDTVLASGLIQRRMYIEVDGSRIIGLYKAGDTYPSNWFSGFYQQSGEWVITPDLIQLFVTLNATNQLVGCSLDHPAAPAVATTTCTDIDHDALWIPSAVSPRKACQIQQLELNAQGDAAPARLTFGDYGGAAGSFPSVTHTPGTTDVRISANSMQFFAGVGERVRVGSPLIHTGNLTVNQTLSVFSSATLSVGPYVLNRYRHATNEHRLDGALNIQQGARISKLSVLDTATMADGGTALIGEGTASIGGRLFGQMTLNVVGSTTFNGPITTYNGTNITVGGAFKTSQDMTVLGNIGKVRDMIISNELQVGGVLRRSAGVEILTNTIRNSAKAAGGLGPAIEFDWGVHIGNQGGDLMYDCGWNFATLGATSGTCNSQHIGLHAQMDCFTGNSRGGSMPSTIQFNGTCSAGDSRAYIFCCTK